MAKVRAMPIKPVKKPVTKTPNIKVPKAPTMEIPERVRKIKTPRTPKPIKTPTLSIPEKTPRLRKIKR
jgi:hypothetical protein